MPPVNPPVYAFDVKPVYVQELLFYDLYLLLQKGNDREYLVTFVCFRAETHNLRTKKRVIQRSVELSHK